MSLLLFEDKKIATVTGVTLYIDCHLINANRLQIDWTKSDLKYFDKLPYNSYC